MQDKDAVQAQIEKILKESPRKKCSCGSEFFDTVTTQHEVSALLSGTGKNEIMLAAILVCHKCGKENEQNRIQI